MEELHLPVELLFFTETKPVVQDVTLQDAVSAMEAMKRGNGAALDDDCDRTGRADGNGKRKESFRCVHGR